MADFCKHCSIEVWGEDSKDLEGLCKNGYVAETLCEHCGPCIVDYDGTCMSANHPECAEKRKEKEDG